MSLILDNCGLSTRLNNPFQRHFTPTILVERVHGFLCVVGDERLLGMARVCVMRGFNNFQPPHCSHLANPALMQSDSASNTKARTHGEKRITKFRCCITSSEYLQCDTDQHRPRVSGLCSELAKNWSERVQPRLWIQESD